MLDWVRRQMIPVILFNDKRLTALVMIMWSFVVLVIFFSLGVLHSTFFRFGPSDKLHFMTVPIDTWGEWILLSLYCCLDTLIKSFGHDAVIPWATTTIVDSKTRTLPYSKLTCLLIIETFYGYVHLSYFFKFFLSFTQFDFVFISTVSDMTMKVYSYSSYMENKTYSPPNVSVVSSDSETLIDSQSTGGVV
jgi:hypothetical protein